MIDLVTQDEWVGNENDPIKVTVCTDAVYIHDVLGEIVSWNVDEWKEDDEVPVCMVNAVLYAMEYGGIALRESINHPITK